MAQTYGLSTSLWMVQLDPLREERSSVSPEQMTDRNSCLNSIAVERHRVGMLAESLLAGLHTNHF